MVGPTLQRDYDRFSQVIFPVAVTARGAQLTFMASRHPGQFIFVVVLKIFIVLFLNSSLHHSVELGNHSVILMMTMGVLAIAVVMVVVVLAAMSRRVIRLLVTLYGNALGGVRVDGCVGRDVVNVGILQRWKILVVLHHDGEVKMYFPAATALGPLGCGAASKTVLLKTQVVISTIDHETGDGEC